MVQQVSGRTEGRADNKDNFDPRMEFWLGLDEFCQERHYWWRRKATSFAVQVGVQTYDLSSNGTGQANAPDCVEIEEMFIVNANPQLWPYNVSPELTAREQIASLFGDSAVQALVPNSGYFLSPGEFQTLAFSTPPVMDYTAAFTYYAVPMVTDVTVDEIPLVPPNLHYGLLYMLERRIYEFLYGQNDPRFLVSNKRYEDFKVIAAKSKSFSSQAAVHMKTSRPAVGAYGGRGYPSRGSGTSGGNNPTY